MPKIIYDWRWEEAFDRFGFDDGDGYCLTYNVAGVLESAGCRCAIAQAGAHNTIIYRITLRNGRVIGPPPSPADPSPHLWLPRALVALLDRELPPDDETEHRRPPDYARRRAST